MIALLLGLVIILGVTDLFVDSSRTQGDVSRTSRQIGDGGRASDISRVSSEAYNANATANDLEQAGKDLGLTPDEMEACRNPQ